METIKSFWEWAKTHPVLAIALFLLIGAAGYGGWVKFNDPYDRWGQKPLDGVKPSTPANKVDPKSFSDWRECMRQMTPDSVYQQCDKAFPPETGVLK